MLPFGSFIVWAGSWVLSERRGRSHGVMIEYRLLLQEAVQTGKDIVVASETELDKIKRQVERLERLLQKMEQKPVDAVSKVWLPKRPH